tara:strand:- start:158 stop:865 length:708 start_codon:yes stop_codon:yes gene_type:complete
MDKIAIVSGASSGLGREISIELSKENYHVVIIGRNKKRLTCTFNEIENNGKKSTLILLDLCKENFVEKLKKKVASINGYVDVVVNNAGLGIFDKIENIKRKDWDNQLYVNLTSSFLISQLFIPEMKQRKNGCLIYVNSVAGKTGYPFSSAYVASKFALRGFANSIREELREFNIKVISVFPGAIDTPFWDNVDADFPREEMMTSREVAFTIINILNKNGVGVVEELVIRRNKGDF